MNQTQTQVQVEMSNTIAHMKEGLVTSMKGLVAQQELVGDIMKTMLSGSILDMAVGSPLDNKLVAQRKIMCDMALECSREGRRIVMIANTYNEQYPSEPVDISYIETIINLADKRVK